MDLVSINPFNLEKIKAHKEMSQEEIESILKKSQSSFESWRKTSHTERIDLIKNLSSNLRKNYEDYAFLMTQEMGKRFKEAEAEILKCADTCDYYIQNGPSFLKSQQISPGATIAFEPLGVILGIMPWNFPFWQVFRFAIPTLLAGNTVVLKHASNVINCSIEIEKIFSLSGFPNGVFQNIITRSEKLKPIIQNNIIQGISLTGSTEAGKSVASLAGECLKKCVLELGGSDPYIILADADLEKTTDICIQSRMLNSGQSCISAKRFIIHASIYEDFKNLLKLKMSKYEMGDPMFATTTLAPLSSIKQRDELHNQVLEAIKNGAHLVLGGNYPIAKGAFYNPTILENISKQNPASVAEFFGPVACLYSFEKIEDAIQIANQTPYGLGAAIFSNQVSMATELIQKEIHSGLCAVNRMVQSTAELPFGGVKQSGYGRELSHFGIHEFTNIKGILHPTI